MARPHRTLSGIQITLAAVGTCSLIFSSPLAAQRNGKPRQTHSSSTSQHREQRFEDHHVLLEIIASIS